MSKPNSGHFSGTTGAKKVSNSIMSNQFESDIIFERTNGLDLTAHPVKNFSSTSLKTIKSKLNKRTASKEEYRKYNQNKRLSKRRSLGVEAFWKQERKRLKNNQTPTRNWSKEQRETILAGNRPKFNGKTMQGHHMFSVSTHPHLANKGNIIFPATYNEHKNGFHGGNFKNSLPGKPIRKIKDF